MRVTLAAWPWSESGRAFSTGGCRGVLDFPNALKDGPESLSEATIALETLCRRALPNAHTCEFPLGAALLSFCACFWGLSEPCRCCSGSSYAQSA